MKFIELRRVTEVLGGNNVPLESFPCVIGGHKKGIMFIYKDESSGGCKTSVA